MEITFVFHGRLKKKLFRKCTLFQQLPKVLSACVWGTRFMFLARSRVRPGAELRKGSCDPPLLFSIRRGLLTPQN